MLGIRKSDRRPWVLTVRGQMCKQMKARRVSEVVCQKPVWFIVGSERGLSEQGYTEGNPQIGGLRKSLTPGAFQRFVEQLKSELKKQN